MTGFLAQLRTSLRLYFRNRMAMLYGYLFPSIFLIAFYVLYRYERVPLVRHMGELLTVTILGGACFGLATTLVSERERGVWRRYRLTPMSAGTLVASTLTARYVILLTAGLVQVLLAMALGMPLPDHLFGIVVAFSIASFAFLGLGLVIAMLADNVPAVQALGQCIFLPMLVIGGVAVPLASLPDWALHLSAYFPGRYAVEAIQSTVNGEGLDVVVFSLLALVAIGLAACVAGAGMFRWDAGQRFTAGSGKGWLAVALAGWVGVGLVAQAQGHVIPRELTLERAANAAAAAATAPTEVAEASEPPPASAPDATAGRQGSAPAAPADARESADVAGAPDEAGPSEAAAVRVGESVPSKSPDAAPADAANARPVASTSDEEASSEASEPTPTSAADATAGREESEPVEERDAAEAPAEDDATPDVDEPDDAVPPTDADAAENAAPASDDDGTGDEWNEVTIDEVMANLVFDRLPPDAGVVTPVASYDDVPPDDVWFELDTIQAGLATWPPGRVPDVLERVRNLLFVPAVVDVFQLPSESFVPLVVFDILQRDIDKDVLVKALYEIAVHPDAGSDAAVDQLRPLGIGSGPSDMFEVRNRVGVSVKLIGRVTGKRPGR